MRYIANSDGYLQQVSFGADITCGGTDCTEYTGAVPADYKSLEDWYNQESEKLYRWKIASGQLTLDSSAAAPAENDYPPVFIQTGTATISYGTAAKAVTVTFPKAFTATPAVFVSQVFDDANIVVKNGDISKTKFEATVAGVFSSSGSRSFKWAAIGK